MCRCRGRRLDPLALLGLPPLPPLSALFNPLDLAFRVRSMAPWVVCCVLGRGGKWIGARASS